MTILVGYTHTPEGAAALHHGREAGRTLGQPLALFPLFETNSEQRWPDPALEAELEPQTQFLAPTEDSPRPAEELVDRSNQLGAALIVIGVRSRSRVGKILMGSDAQSIILGATVPVLSVKAASDER